MPLFITPFPSITQALTPVLWTTSRLGHLCPFITFPFSAKFVVEPLKQKHKTQISKFNIIPNVQILNV